MEGWPCYHQVIVSTNALVILCAKILAVRQIERMIIDLIQKLSHGVFNVVLVYNLIYQNPIIHAISLQNCKR